MSSCDKSLLLKNGRIIDPANNLDEVSDLLIKDGTIAAIFSKDQPQTVPAEIKIYDLSNKWVMPGFIDMHVHLREPGEEYKETIISGALAAAAGGFTAVASMPNTNPPHDNPAVTSLILNKAQQARARIYPVGCISKGGVGEGLAAIGEMKQAGVVAVTDDGRPVIDSQLMRRVLEYAQSHNLLVISHSEEISLSRYGVMNEGGLSTSLGLRGIPSVAEEIMVYRDLALAEYTGCPLHLAHISTRESVSLIRRAKKRHVAVTAETAPHYFSLTEQAVKQYNTSAKMNPPLRSQDDVEAIRQGLQDGTLDAIATDHAPHSSMEKDVEFDLAANGIIGLETAVPLTLALVRDGCISVHRMVELFSINPARILGVAGGSLTAGSSADITVVDPDLKFVYTADQIVSKSKNSPFIDCSFQGKAVMTIMSGQITFMGM